MRGRFGSASCRRFGSPARRLAASSDVQRTSRASRRVALPLQVCRNRHATEAFEIFAIVAFKGVPTGAVQRSILWSLSIHSLAGEQWRCTHSTSLERGKDQRRS